MGEVFLARRIAPLGPNGGVAGQRCVVKRMQPDLSRHDAFIQRFHEEATVAVRLRHENVVRMFEAGICAGRHYLALEYVDGPDLRRLLTWCWRRSTRLPQPVALFIAHEVLSALGYGHALRARDGSPLNLVHGDISPSNILVSRQGHVKILDLGLARTRATLVGVRPNLVFGKIGYLAPEQVHGWPVDHRTDIYSVGVVLYELLTGQRLVTGARASELLEAVVHPSLVPPSQRCHDVPRELDRILLRALAEDPERRFSSAEEFRVALVPLLGMPLPELRAITGQCIVDAMGHTDVPAVRQGRGGPMPLEDGSVEVEGLADITTRVQPVARRERRSHGETPAACDDRTLMVKTRLPRKQRARGARERGRAWGTLALWLASLVLVGMALLL